MRCVSTGRLAGRAWPVSQSDGSHLSVDLPKHFALSHAAAAARGGCGPGAKFPSPEILGLSRMSAFTHSRAIRANSLITLWGINTCVSTQNKWVRSQTIFMQQAWYLAAAVALLARYLQPGRLWLRQREAFDALHPRGNIRLLLCTETSALSAGMEGIEGR